VMLEPNMELFHDLSNRVMNYLCRERVLSQEVGARGLEVMKPYAVQLVVHQAHHSAFDMPWSPNWKKPFEVKHIREEQRYLYCTVEIVWWCWTAMACEWISEINAHTIEAAVESLGVDWDPTVSAYAMYESDLQDRIRWRVHPAPAQVGGGGGGGGRSNGGDDGNRILVDLNYISFEGDIPTVAKKIADASHGRVTIIDVVGALTVLQKEVVELPGGGLIPQPAAQFKRYHRYRTLPSEDGSVPGEKETALSDGSMGIPNVYCFREPRQDVARTEADVPHYPVTQQFTPVEVTVEGGKTYVHIMPMVANSFKTSAIIDALVYATTCKSSRPGKMLLGLPADNDSMQLQVFDCPAPWIAETVQGLDEACNIIDGRWRPKAGEPDRVELLKPVSRREGIAFTRRGGISKLDAKFIEAVPLAPVNEQTRDAKMQRTKADLAGMQEMKEVVRDLDYHSARTQHLRCGLPVDEPVHDPAWIEQAFSESGGQSEHMHYPQDWLEDNLMRSRVFETLNDTTGQAAFLRKRRAHSTVAAPRGRGAAAAQRRAAAAAAHNAPNAPVPVAPNAPNAAAAANPRFSNVSAARVAATLASELEAVGNQDAMGAMQRLV